MWGAFFLVVFKFDSEWGWYNAKMEKQCCFFLMACRHSAAKAGVDTASRRLHETRDEIRSDLVAAEVQFIRSQGDPPGLS